jgi:hypothetical protein
MHNGCVVTGGVGSGKSITALAYYYTKVADGRLRINGVGEDEAPKRPIDVYIVTTAKKRDSKEWEGEAARFRISREREASIAQIKLTVVSWNEVINYVDVKDAFFIFDEQRLVGYGAWVKAFLKIAKSNQWILLSATPGDTWMDYAAIFIAHGFYKNITEFRGQHVKYSNHTSFPKIEAYLEVSRLEAYRRQVLVDMPFHRHTTRFVESIIVDYDKKLFDTVWEDRWNPFEGEPIKDVAEMFRVGRRISNQDPSRLNAIMRLLEKHPRLIVFYNFDYELEMLRTIGNVLNVPQAEWNGHKHQEIPDTEKWLYLVQYTAGAEGWNCVTTDAMAFYSLNYSYKIWEQAQGRIDRMNTPFVELHYYVVRSAAKIDILINKALTQKRNFNERKYVKQHPERFPEPERPVKSYGLGSSASQDEDQLRGTSAGVRSDPERANEGHVATVSHIARWREPSDPGWNVDAAS